MRHVFFASLLAFSIGTAVIGPPEAAPASPASTHLAATPPADDGALPHKLQVFLDDMVLTYRANPYDGVDPYKDRAQCERVMKSDTFLQALNVMLQSLGKNNGSADLKIACVPVQVDTDQGK